MKVTVDANVLFSALIKKGKTRKIWFGPEIELFSPKYLLIEFQKYAGFLRRKFKGTEEEFTTISKKLLLQINFVSDQELKPFLPAVIFLIDDPKDWLYLACALKEDTIIWSNDKGFKKQKRIHTKTTTEMIEEFGTL